MPVVVNTVGVYFVPESPYWLVEHGRASEARTSLLRLRRPASSVEQELQEIIEKKKSKEGLEVSLLGKLTSRQFLLPFFRQMPSLTSMDQCRSINELECFS